MNRLALLLPLTPMTKDEEEVLKRIESQAIRDKRRIGADGDGGVAMKSDLIYKIEYSVEAEDNEGWEAMLFAARSQIKYSAD